MRAALARIRQEETVDVLDFAELQTVVGFPEYYAGEERYAPREG